MNFTMTKRVLLLVMGLLVAPAAMIMSNPDETVQAETVSTSPSKTNRFYWKQIARGLGVVTTLTLAAGAWVVYNIDSLEFHAKLSKYQFRDIYEMRKLFPTGIFRATYPDYSPLIGAIQNFFL